MTAHVLQTRNELTEQLINETVRKALPAHGLRQISISARDSHSGEPALYVYVLMSDENQIPEIEAQNQLSADLLTALQHIGDDRFPYVSYGPRKADVPLGGDAS